MIAQFGGFEISPIHNGDAWKICDFCVANSDRLKRYFPKDIRTKFKPDIIAIVC